MKKELSVEEVIPTFQSVLKKFGFTKANWDKCPKGYKEQGFPCYKHSDGSWCELYLTDTVPYGNIWLTGYKSKNFSGGQYIETPKHLRTILSEWYNTQNSKP